MYLFRFYTFKIKFTNIINIDISKKSKKDAKQQAAKDILTVISNTNKNSNIEHYLKVLNIELIAEIKDIYQDVDIF